MKTENSEARVEQADWTLYEVDTENPVDFNKYEVKDDKDYTV